ncbi:hypothetical protein CA54_60750 [Symmachiella macrocystis]|uniref:Uncharacterized protein n=1 Tax=Symmachiella macrocystis TaxID=2527985 RepID=A0A5C6AW80_9PLAN|nr:hypothetical protein CA54_60750 [Symmachiella macrocystis]
MFSKSISRLHHDHGRQICGGWTNFSGESGPPTCDGVNDRGKIQPAAIVGVSDRCSAVPKTCRKADLIDDMRRNSTLVWFGATSGWGFVSDSIRYLTHAGHIRNSYFLKESMCRDDGHLFLSARAIKGTIDSNFRYSATRNRTPQNARTSLVERLLPP